MAPWCREAGIAIAAGVLLLTAGHVSPVHAAVRHCLPPIVAAGEDAESESAARRQALERWVAAAARLGKRWASWRLAVGRELSCVAASGGGHACRAVASPCTITQNPASPAPIDPGAKPPGRQRDAVRSRSIV